MIFKQLKLQLKSLSDLLSLLNDTQYSKKVAHLGNSSIGGHTRHIIELIQCANLGLLSGTVDYINRTRNIEIEYNRILAQDILLHLIDDLKGFNKKLNLVVEELDDTKGVLVNTSYFREIVYNTEHTIHHLALIKVALIEMNLNFVDDNFGMAYSTIKYKAAQIKNN